VGVDEIARIKSLLPSDSKGKGGSGGDDKILAMECKQFRDLSAMPSFDVNDLIDAEQVLYKLYQIDNLSAKIDVIAFLLTSSTSVKNFIQKCEILASTAGMCQRDDEIECGIALYGVCHCHRYMSYH